MVVVVDGWGAGALTKISRSSQLEKDPSGYLKHNPNLTTASYSKDWDEQAALEPTIPLLASLQEKKTKNYRY